MSKPVDVKTAISNLPNIRVIRVGQDLFIEKVADAVEDDLHQELRDINDQT